MTALAKKRVRGQALVELTLGALVFITVLMFGIFFGEVVFGELKLTEAATAALYDVTHYKHHTMGFTYDTGPIATAVTKATADGNLRYSNYDGRTSQIGLRNTPTHTFAKAAPMTVKCEQGGAVPYHPNVIFIASYTDNNGVNCSAEGTFTSVNLPTKFMEKSASGFFKADNWTARPITGCALGRHRGGKCTAQFNMNVDDWGLTDPTEDGACIGLPIVGAVCAGNAAYWWTTDKAFMTNGTIGGVWPPPLGRAGTVMAASLLGNALGPMGLFEEYNFLMTFEGEQVLFQSYVGGESIASMPYPTTPFAPTTPTGDLYSVSWGLRSQCYMGQACP